MEYPAINIVKDTANQGLFFDVNPGVYDIWAIEYGYSTYQTQNRKTISFKNII